MIGRFGKSLESAFRGIRPYLLPSYRASYQAFVARGMSERNENDRIVCCDFANPKIDSVGGRYYFSLVRDLIDAGYFPVFTQHRVTLSTFGTSPMKSLLLRERMGTVRDLAELREPYFLITDRPGARNALAVKSVFVSYQRRLCQGPDEIAFPVFVHPQLEGQPFHYDVEDQRSTRIFFGGNTEEGKYDRDIIREEYHMLTRREMLAAAASATPPYRPTNALAWLAGGEFQPFVLCETQRCKIPRNRWLAALGEADFFLAAPGVGMPLCHNLIEALTAGAVPILQYADYLPDPLEDGKNCLSFRDAAGLREIVGKVLKLSAESIVEMRRAVRDYYDEFLAPGRFAERLFTAGPDHKTLLLNAYRVPR